MDALHSKAVDSANTVKESFCGSLASLVLRSQTLLTQEATAVSKFVDDSGRKALIELCGTISKL